jgi:hypothetical protein
LPKRGGVHIPGQPFLPFKELKNTKPPEEPADSVILFHILKKAKDSFAAQAKEKDMSLTRLLNELIADFLSKITPAVKKATGRGHIDFMQIERAKDCLRKNPKGVQAVEIANYVGCSQARAVRLMDILSDGVDFLVYQEDEVKPTRYFISKDTQIKLPEGFGGRK